MNKLRKLLASIAAFGMLLTSVPAVATAGFGDVSDGNEFAGYIDHGVDKGYFSSANDNFYPNNNLTRGELAKIAVIGAGLEEDTTKGPHFEDVAEDNAFYPYVETLLNNGAISAHKTFRPNDKVTRAEAAKILVMAFGFEVNTDGGPTFPDVAADNAFYVYVETAANNNLVNGYKDGNFGPYNNITRAEAAKILAMATGYTGTWGEAAGVVLTLSADTVDVGGSLNMTAKVVDADGNTVQDYDGVAEFAVSTGNISDKSVDLVRGQAKVTYTAPGYGAEGNVTVKVDGYTDEAEFSVVIPEDQKMMLYAADYKVSGTDTTTLYLTLSDDKGNPVNGKASDLTFDVTGDATVGTVAAFPGGADGVYRATLTTAAASVGVNTITVTDNETGESTKVDVEVGQPTMEVYLVDPVVSVGQTTTLLVYLTQGDGSPITGAAANLSSSFLNAELGATSAEAEIAAGWYKYTVTADNRVSEDAKVKVSYTGVTPNVHEYVSLKVAPYNISVEVTPDDINNLTGVATLIVSLTDVNGKPIDLDTGAAGLDYAIDSKLDVDVITSAVWQDPSGNQDFAAADWSWYNDVAAYAGNDGVLVTHIYACGVKDGSVPVSTCIVDDSSVEIKVREKSAVNKVVEAEATISFSDPIIDKVQNFNVTGNFDVLVASVIDAKGAGITDLASQAAAGDTNGAALDTYFLADGATLHEIDVVHTGGGVYLLGSNADTDVDKLTVGNDDADYQTLSDATTTAGNYVVVGDNSIAEGYTAAGTVRGGAVVTVVAANVPVSVAAVTLTSDDTGTVNSPTLVKVTNGTASRALDVNGDGVVAAADDALVTGINFTDPSAVANAVSAYPVDNIETATLTTSVGGTNVNTTTVSVHPIRVKFVSLDANGKTTDDAYGYLKTVNNDGRLEEVGVANVSNPDANGAANAAEIAFNNYDNTVGVGGTDVAGVYPVKYERADGNNDSNEKAEIEFNLNGDDESMNISTWKFDLVNPTYDVYIQNDSTYVTPNTDAANGATVEAQNAVFVLTVSRNDEGVAQDVSNATEVVLELAAGDGDVDDAADLTRDTAETQNLTDDATAGVYYGYYFPADSARLSNLELYTGFDDDNDKYAFDIDVVYPTAQVVVYPTKIDPDKQNNEATVIAIIKDQFGNAVPNLSVTGTNPDLSVEIEGDQKLTSSDATADTMYYGNYSTDKTGTQTVEVKYNDDETLQTSEIQVEMIK